MYTTGSGEKTIRGVKRPELSRHTTALTFLSATVELPFPKLQSVLIPLSVTASLLSSTSCHTLPLLLLGTLPLCSGFRPFSDPLPHLQTVKIIYPRRQPLFLYVLCLRKMKLSPLKTQFKAYSSPPKLPQCFR